MKDLTYIDGVSAIKSAKVFSIDGSEKVANIVIRS